MSTIRVLKFSTAIDLGGFDAGVRKMHQSGGGALVGIGKTLTFPTPSLGGIAKVAAGFGLVGMAGAQVGRAFDFVKGGIAGASELNETLSKTQAIFGGSADVITAQADRMAEAFGTSKNEYITSAGNFGAVFKGLGKPQAEAAELGNQLAKLGMDMASFDNTTNAEAFTAISAALRGEMDPIERFRVFLSADKVSAEALALGLAKTKGEIDDTAKKMAVMSLITKQTADAQGDLERTAGGTANQQRRLGGVITNLGTDIGKSLLPAFDAALAGVNGLVGFLASAFEANRPAIEGFVGSLVYGFGAVNAAAAFVARPILDFGRVLSGAMLAGGGALASFLPSFESIANFDRTAFGSIAMFLEDIIGRVGMLPEMLNAAFGEGTTGMLGGFATMIGQGITVAFEVVGFGLRNFGDLIEYAFVSATLHVGAFMENASKLATFIGGNWLELMIAPFATLGGVIEQLGTAIVAFFKDPTQGFQFSLNMADVIKPITDLQSRLPEFAAADTAGSPELAAIQKRIDEREAGFAATTGEGFKLPETADQGFVLKANDYDPFADPGMTADAARKGKGKGDELKFAGAMDLGSKEAYSTISGALAGVGAGDKVAKTANATLAENRKQTRFMERVAKAAEGEKTVFDLVTI